MDASATHRPNSVPQRWGRVSGALAWIPHGLPESHQPFKTKNFRDVPALQAWMKLLSLIQFSFNRFLRQLQVHE